MAFENMLVAGNISASGMGAERLRMEVIANNIANALATRSATGGPYRRQEILFQAIMDQQTPSLGTNALGMGGVQVVGVVDDPSTLPRIHNPGHPDADGEGFVTMPNVSIPIVTVPVPLITPPPLGEAVVDGPVGFARPGAIAEAPQQVCPPDTTTPGGSTVPGGSLPATGASPMVILAFAAVLTASGVALLALRDRTPRA